MQQPDAGGPVVATGPPEAVAQAEQLLLEEGAPLEEEEVDAQFLAELEHELREEPEPAENFDYVPIPVKDMRNVTTAREEAEEVMATSGTYTSGKVVFIASHLALPVVPCLTIDTFHRMKSLAIQ